MESELFERAAVAFLKRRVQFLKISAFGIHLAERFCAQCDSLFVRRVR
jgi:hypothetical protein